MFLLGHLGIGKKIASPWAKGLPLPWLFLGTILPDLIDKPLYYSQVFITGRHGRELGWITGTRSIGHTAILLLIVAGTAMARRSKILAALALGMATHLVLDSVGEQFGPMRGMVTDSSLILALLYPLYDFRFPILQHKNAAEHLSALMNSWVVGAELVGATLLAWDYWKSSHKAEILQMLTLRRLRKRKLKKHVRGRIN